MPDPRVTSADARTPDAAQGPGTPDALTWVEKAELEALAGDGLGSKASLEHATALNGLVRGSGQWREAEALVGAPH